ncbi:deoxyguanosinetriphosphate triphosphohydrolase [Thermoproteota archaeon]
MRSYFEELELRQLAPYAVKSRFSKGREYPEPDSPTRTLFQRDRDRIVHSKSFRRLKHKTQVFIVTVSDHYRSRLTHTLEVAQISRHLARLLRLNEDLAEAVSLAHDLGHTPFGHSGEQELNRLMSAYGGFEHNLQSRRVVDQLEQKYPDFPGLNLSFEVREGLIKHQTPWDKPNNYQHYTTLEAQVVNVSDEIAYNNHDLDDGLSSGILNESELSKKVTLWKEVKDNIQKKYTNLSKSQLKTLINSYLISAQIENVMNTTIAGLKKCNLKNLDDLQVYSDPLVSFSEEMKEKNNELRAYLFNEFYAHYHIYRMNKKGQLIIRGLFNAFNDDTLLLPDTYQHQIKAGASKERVICDYIACMTDIFAQKELAALNEAFPL